MWVMEVWSILRFRCAGSAGAGQFYGMRRADDAPVARFATRPPASHATMSSMADRLRTAAIVLAVIGTAIAGYLTYVHYAGVSPVCEIAHGCEKVQTSDWSKLAGIPVALLGLLTYVAILGSLLLRGERPALLAAVLSLVGFGFSAYLTYREVFTIEAICIWCVGSAIVLTLLAIVTTARVVREPAVAAR
jgi:uncharacterized membrane protein